MTAPGTASTRLQAAGDVSLALALTAIAVAVHLDGSEAVAANHDPGVFSVALTVLATAPVVLRRRAPLVVLVVTLGALIVMVATHNTVGMSTLGPTVAFYSAVAHAPRREVRTALWVTAGGVAIGALLRPVDLSTEGAIVNTVVLVGAWVLGTGVRQRREAYEAEVVATRERAALSAAEERLRITRELHDIVGHALGVMVVQAGVAEELLASRPEEARRAVAEIGATGRASLSEMRQVLGSLRGDESAQRAPLPGLSALDQLVARVDGAGLPVAVEIRGDLTGLSAGLDLTAYRVVQEALTNTLKHSGASEARVSLDRSESELRIRVVDDGSAVPGMPNLAGGHGLVGMRERVTVFGGHLVAEPQAEGGFLVEAVLPTVGEQA